MNPENEQLDRCDSTASSTTDPERCPLCEGRRLHYALSTVTRRVVQCADCRLVLLTAATAGDRASAGPVLGVPDDGIHRVFLEDRVPSQDVARYHLAGLVRYRGSGEGAFLVIDPGTSTLALEASHCGYNVTRVCLSQTPASSPTMQFPQSTPRFRQVTTPSLKSLGAPVAGFDICALDGVLERSADPLEMLRFVRRLLKPGGTLLLSTSALLDLADEPVEACGAERLVFFDSATLQTALHRSGFDHAIVRNRPDTEDDQEIGPVQTIRRLLKSIGFLNSTEVTGSSLALARPAAEAAGATLSVVVPVFNEAATVGPLLDALVEKTIPGIDIEVIVVESNSSDGTRSIVEQYASHPRVRLILEDRPRGKGHAVRTGLTQARGAYVLIQDADLEYDLEDYDALLEPLVAGREAFVLGSRHGGNEWWKLRKFAGQPLTSFVMNLGHQVFTMLVNVLFGQRLKDPFTMFKVFRRDCLYGLDFVCNRFDFDYELLVKLIRKGYTPVEVPVNYRSRSFDEGKKVSVIRDPLTWLAAIAWLRFIRIDPLAQVEQRRLIAAAIAEEAGSETREMPVHPTPESRVAA